MDGWIQDVRFAARSFVRYPGFTAAVIGTLSLGIAANVAIFTVVSGILIQPLPFERPHDIVILDQLNPNGFRASVSIPNYYDWSTRNRSFEAVAAFNPTNAPLTGPEGADMMKVDRVMGEFFDLLGVMPLLGRVISPADAEPGGEAIAVLTYGAWVRRFGADPAVLGQTVTLWNAPFEIVGVMPRDFAFGEDGIEAYVPLGLFSRALEWDTRSSGNGTMVVARLSPGVSIEAAQADMNRLAGEIEAEEGPEPGIGQIEVLTDWYVGEARLQIVLLMGAVVLVLLIACANVANLLLARGERRRQEIALRASLGAGRRRVARQLLTESLLLGGTGGLVGTVVGGLSVPVLVSILPAHLPAPMLDRVGVDPTVLLFALATSLATALVFGFVPALRGSGTDLVSALKGGRSSGGYGHNRVVMDALIAAEVGLSLILLVGAGLLIQSLSNLREVDKGFDEEGVVTLRFPVSTTEYTTQEEWLAFHGEFADRVRALPGVSHASSANLFPLSGSNWERGIAPEGGEDVEIREPVLYTIADVDYFGALGIEIVRGRGFTEADRLGSPLVTVIDEPMAEKFWPGENPIGKRVTYEVDEATGLIPIFRTVVGVAKHVRNYDLAAPSRVGVYSPIRQASNWGFTTYMVIRSQLDPGTVVSAVRAELRAMDPGVPIYLVRPLEAVVDARLSTETALQRLLAVFGALALILAFVGIYGVVSYSVAARRRETGIRMALGAQRASVLAALVGSGMRPTVAGAAVGLVGAWVLTRLLTTFLFGVTPLEPVVVSGALTVLLAAGGLAAYFPARRASRVEPGRVLRED